MAKLLILVNRLLWAAVAIGVIYFVIGPGMQRLIPWYVYGSRAAELDIRVVEIAGRHARMNNGWTVHESVYTGLIVAMLVGTVVTMAGCAAIAMVIERRIARRAGRAAEWEAG